MAFTFEKLLVYQKSVDLADQICSKTEEFPRGYGFLVDQLNRAALSIAANIAEGNGRRINILAKYSVSKGVLTQTLVRAEQYGKPISSLSKDPKKLKVRMEGDTLYFSAPAKGGTEMPFKRVKP